MDYLSGYLPQALSSQPESNPETAKPLELAEKDKEQEVGECTSVTQPLSNWFNDLYANRNELWKKIKDDFTEVACVAKTDPKEVLGKTANSISKGVSNVIHSIDQEIKHVTAADGESKLGIDVNGIMHHLGTGISSLSSLGNSYITSYLLPPTQDDSGEETLTLDLDSLALEEQESDKTSIDVKIKILRADPRTFSTVPRPVQGITTYEDWFNAYFDENTCQPRLGVPLPVDLVSERPETTLTPKHPAPAQILEECPAVKNHLLRLVNPELGLRRSNNVSEEGLSEVDFWSRYYYRVWCLEIIEARRIKLLSVAKQTHSANTSNVNPSVNLPKAKSNASSVKGNEDDLGSTPEVLTVKSESPVLLSDHEESKQEKYPNTPTKLDEKLSKSDEIEEEEDDWEKWS